MAALYFLLGGDDKESVGSAVTFSFLLLERAESNQKLGPTRDSAYRKSREVARFVLVQHTLTVSAYVFLEMSHTTSRAAQLPPQAIVRPMPESDVNRLSRPIPSLIKRFAACCGFLR